MVALNGGNGLTFFLGTPDPFLASLPRGFSDALALAQTLRIQCVGRWRQLVKKIKSLVRRSELLVAHLSRVRGVASRPRGKQRKKDDEKRGIHAGAVFSIWAMPAVTIPGQNRRRVGHEIRRGPRRHACVLMSISVHFPFSC
jgi:hypothetical protein